MEGWRNGIGAESPIELTVNVCTTGCWPTSSVSTVTQPTVIQTVCEQFKTFYLAKHHGRRLVWRMDQGKADVQVWYAFLVAGANNVCCRCVGECVSVCLCLFAFVPLCVCVVSVSVLSL